MAIQLQREGSGVGALAAPQGPFFDITAYGAVAGGPAVANQTAINNAINAAAAAGGGTVAITTAPGEGTVVDIVQPLWPEE